MVLEPSCRVLFDKGGGMVNEVDDERDEREGRAYVGQDDHKDCL